MPAGLRTEGSAPAPRAAGRPAAALLVPVAGRVPVAHRVATVTPGRDRRRARVARAPVARQRGVQVRAVHGHTRRAAVRGLREAHLVPGDPPGAPDPPVVVLLPVAVARPERVDRRVPAGRPGPGARVVRVALRGRPARTAAVVRPRPAATLAGVATVPAVRRGAANGRTRHGPVPARRAQRHRRTGPPGRGERPGLVVPCGAVVPRGPEVRPAQAGPRVPAVLRVPAVHPARTVRRGPVERRGQARSGGTLRPCAVGSRPDPAAPMHGRPGAATPDRTVLAAPGARPVVRPDRSGLVGRPVPVDRAGRPVQAAVRAGRTGSARQRQGGLTSGVRIGVRSRNAPRGRPTNALPARPPGRRPATGSEPVRPAARAGSMWPSPRGHPVEAAGRRPGGRPGPGRIPRRSRRANAAR